MAFFFAKQRHVDITVVRRDSAFTYCFLTDHNNGIIYELIAELRQAQSFVHFGKISEKFFVPFEKISQSNAPTKECIVFFSKSLNLPRDTNSDEYEYSIGQVITKYIFRWVGNLVSSFDIGPDRTRVGIVVYSDVPRLAVALQDHSTKDDLLVAVRNIEYLTGTQGFCK